MRITNVSHDSDTGRLDIRLENGWLYSITDRSAALIRDRITAGTKLNDAQLRWLAKYRVQHVADKSRMLAVLQQLRQELRP